MRPFSHEATACRVQELAYVLVRRRPSTSCPAGWADIGV